MTCLMVSGINVAGHMAAMGCGIKQHMSCYAGAKTIPMTLHDTFKQFQRPCDPSLSPLCVDQMAATATNASTLFDFVGSSPQTARSRPQSCSRMPLPSEPSCAIDPNIRSALWRAICDQSKIHILFLRAYA